jgi:hypothetical protein
MAFCCLHRDSQRVAKFEGWKFVLGYKLWGVGGWLEDEKTTWEGCKNRGSFKTSQVQLSLCSVPPQLSSHTNSPLIEAFDTEELRIMRTKSF